jgi:hypothetical protein
MKLLGNEQQMGLNIMRLRQKRKKVKGRERERDVRTYNLGKK